MTRTLLFALTATVFAQTVFALPAAAAPRQTAIEAIRPWIAPPPSGAPTAAGYVVLKNREPTTDIYLGASTPVAEKLELHVMSMAGGVMRMRPVGSGVSIAAGGSLTLAPGGGYHFMIVHPKHPLKIGDHVPATLNFAKAGAVRIVFTVQNAPTP